MHLNLYCTKPISSKRGYNMDLKLCWLNRSHYREDTICLTRPNQCHASEETKYISTLLTKPLTFQRGNKNEYQLVFSNPIPCLQGHDMYLNMWPKSLPCQRGQIIHLSMCWPGISHASEKSNASQHVLTKPPTCQRGHYLQSQDVLTKTPI
jgi:hypothetical protein